MLVSTSILFSSAGYSQKDWKSNAIYEVIKIPIYMMDEIYQAVMNKRLLKYSTTKSACGEYIIKGFIYIVGLVVCIGLFLNICLSGYFIANRETVEQENIQLIEEVGKVKQDMSVYGNVHDLKIISIGESKVQIIKGESFVFENTIEGKRADVVCSKIIEKNGFERTNTLKREESAIFQKKEYIILLRVLNDKQTEINIKRAGWLGETKWQDGVNLLLLITSPLNPFRALNSLHFTK